MPGKPLQRAAQVTDDSAVALAVDALLHGPDEDPNRDTTAQGWNTLHYGEGDDAMKMWYEELEDIDKAISENVEVDPTQLPTSELSGRLDAAIEALSTCYTLPVPVWHKRMLHIHYNELAEVAGDLRAGKINAAEGEARFASVMADVNEIVDFSNLFGA